MLEVKYQMERFNVITRFPINVVYSTFFFINVIHFIFNLFLTFKNVINKNTLHYFTSKDSVFDT